MKQLVLGIVVALASCSPTTGEDIQNQSQAQTTTQAAQQVGFPATPHFFEKRLLKSIYELRDKEIPTFAYTQDMMGRYHFLCNSIGYGIPYSTQYSNPEGYQRVHAVSSDGESSGYADEVLPQAEPNGLYSPAEAAGTWVLCVDPKTGQDHPVYVEPNIIVSPFQLSQH